MFQLPKYLVFVAFSFFIIVHVQKAAINWTWTGFKANLIEQANNWLITKIDLIRIESVVRILVNGDSPIIDDFFIEPFYYLANLEIAITRNAATQDKGIFWFFAHFERNFVEYWNLETI